MKLILSIIYLVLVIQIKAQKLSGVWTGYLKTPESELAYELAIDETNKKISGYSITIYTKDGVENVGLKKINIRIRKGEIFLEDGDLIFNNYSTPPKKAKLLGSLLLQKRDTAQILTGIFRTRSLDFRDNNTYEGRIYLQRQRSFKQTKLIAKLEELDLLNTLTFLTTKPEVPEITSIKKFDTTNMGIAKQKTTVKNKPNEKKAEPSEPEKNIVATPARKTEIIREIGFTSDSLRLSLVDNGTVDGDTVSVLLNGITIISKGALKAEPIRITIPVNTRPGDSLLLVMVAENLGSIPPNTGLLVIQDGTERYEIRFEGDLQKSSAIVLRRVAPNNRNF